MQDKLTHEEERVPIYQSDTLPTAASSVTPETPLESINLNWTERDLPEKQRTKHVHRLHPYLGKYIPQLTEVFLRKYFAAGQTVLDPFAGSGTTLVQANELGIHAIGCDISEFNVTICRAKTDLYDLRQVREELTDILSRTKVQSQSSLNDLPLFRHLEDKVELTDTDNSYLNMWFAPQARLELLTYRRLIEDSSYQYKTLLKVILSRAARSARLTTHFDLDFPRKPQTEPYWCYKHSRTCHPTTDALKFLNRYTIDTIKRITEFQKIRTDTSVVIHHSDSRYTQYPLIDGVLTSPPYVGLIDYHDQHAYAYHLLGMDDHRDAEIGAAAKGKSKRAVGDYLSDMVAVFKNALNAMRSGGRLIVVAGDRDNLYPQIAAQIGVETEAVIQRHVNRRTGRRSGEFFESVFIWQKI